MKTQQLHICIMCDSPLMQSVERRRQGKDWWLLIRCPDCECTREGCFSCAAVEEFDRMRARGRVGLRYAIARLEQEQHEDDLVAMESDASILSRALADDLLTAEDFR